MYSNTLLHWLDMEDKNGYTSTVKELFEEFAHKAILLPDGSYQISLNDNGDPLVKFQDIIGWTDGISIKKRIVEEWCEIYTHAGSMIVHNKEFIPIYFPDNPVDVFHGDIKYPYILKQVGKITEEDHIRLIIDNKSKFIIPEIRPIENTVMWLYEIITKSRFMNVDRFHIFASDEITIDEAKAWEAEDGKPRISMKCIK